MLVIEHAVMGATNVPGERENRSVVESRSVMGKDDDPRGSSVVPCQHDICAVEAMLPPTPAKLIVVAHDMVIRSPSSGTSMRWDNPSSSTARRNASRVSRQWLIVSI